MVIDNFKDSFLQAVVRISGRNQKGLCLEAVRINEDILRKINLSLYTVIDSRLEQIILFPSYEKRGGSIISSAISSENPIQSSVNVMCKFIKRA